MAVLLLWIFPTTARNSICPYALPEISHFMTGKIWGIWRPVPNTGTDSFITHNIRNISGKPGRTGSLRMILLQLDTTDDFKFEKFRIDKDSATCRRDCERIALFLVCLSMSPERPVRGDMAEEDDDPDRAAQFCVNMRSTSAAQSSVWGRFHDEVYPIQEQSVRQVEPGDHAPAT